MKILVTGGAGFIGSHICEALLKTGHQVLVMDNLSTGRQEQLPKGVEFFKLDITSEGAFEQLPAGIEAIIHLAAQISVPKSVEDPIFDAQVNVLGTLAVLEYARGLQHKLSQLGGRGVASIKVIYASSCGVYGAQENLPIKESATCKPLAPYTLSKLCGEQYMQLYARHYGLDTTVLRFGNVYGPRQYKGENSGVISLFAHLAQQKMPLRLEGDGLQTRDFIYIADIVAATMLALENSVDGPVNIGTGQPVSLQEVIAQLQAALGYDLVVENAPDREGDIKHSVLENIKAKEVLGWQAEIGLAEGVRKLVND